MKLSAGLVTLAVLGAGSAAAQPVKRSAPVSGKVVSKRGGETAALVPARTQKPLAVRQDLKAGDVIRTNAKGALSIVFADRTQIRLARNSVLRVKAVVRGSPSSLRLERGKAWGRTPRKGRGSSGGLSVETPAATAGIRGTEWALSVEGERTTLEVFEGEVELTNDFGSLSVAGGEAASARLGQAPVRIALVNRDGREQMLYFSRLEDGIDLFPDLDPAAKTALREGEWDRAIGRLDTGSATPREAEVKQFARFLAEVRLGRDPELPPLNESEAASFAVRGQILSYLSESADAQAVVDRGLKSFPDARELHELKVRIALLKGDGDTAQAAVDTALSRFAGDATFLSLRAEIAANYSGAPYAALKDAEAAVLRDPESPRILASAAAIQLERGAGREALASIDKAIAGDPQNAAYHAQRATILMELGQVEEAKPSLDRALQIDPSLSILRASLAEYHLLKGDLAAALDDALAASAENPAYARAMLQLAQINFRLGESAAAVQQLDAADRLDPASPYTPLARTAVALNRFDADGAIEGAGEALRRYRARGGDYANLSENRATGSLVSQAFRFLGMEGWGRYYADRVFDSFTPSSYFDQALNQTPGPFVIRDADGSFDTSNAEDLDQLSSFLQGLALDPLSVANPERELLFDNGAFVEPELRVSLLEESQRGRRQIDGEFDAIFTGAVPVGIGLTASFTDESDERGRPDIDFFTSRDGGQDIEVEGFVGLDAGAFDQLVISGAYNDAETRASSNQFAVTPDQASEPRELVEDENRFLFGLWSHEFGQRSRSTLAFGTGRLGSVRELFDDDTRLGATLPDRIFYNAIDFNFASASYAHSIGFVDLRAGGEYADILSDQRDFPFDADRPETRDTTEVPNLELDIIEWRAFGDIRARIGDDLLVQAHAAYLDISAQSQVEGGFDPGSSSTGFFDWRLAAAYEPVAGQWIRLAAERDTEGLFAFTFAPINTLGLKGNVAPRSTSTRSRSLIARWDAQWSKRFFTSVEYQDQRHDVLDYEIPDLTVDVGGGPVDVDRATVQANYWAGDNLGLRASYSYTDSSLRGLFASGLTSSQALGGGFGCASPEIDPFLGCEYSPGQQLPFVPEHIAQVGAVWTLSEPVRLRAELSANYVGGQIDDINSPIEDYVTVDLRLRWEPWDRRAVFDLAALNLLDESYENAALVPAPGFTLIASAGFRF
ncbi:MAG: FecR domain-containing protein [Pseudomonadota bacterium]|nr:FecR domain-containing protein [Pseudomonadota bacterium]